MALFPNSQGSKNFDAIFIDLKCCLYFFFSSSPELQRKIEIHIMVLLGQEILQQPQVSLRPGAFSTALNHVSQQDPSPCRNKATRSHPRCSICLPNLPFSFLQQEILLMGSTKYNLPLFHTAQCNHSICIQNMLSYNSSMHWLHTLQAKSPEVQNSSRWGHSKAKDQICEQSSSVNNSGFTAHFPHPFPKPCTSTATTFGPWGGTSKISNQPKGSLLNNKYIFIPEEETRALFHYLRRNLRRGNITQNWFSASSIQKTIKPPTDKTSNSFTKALWS